MLYVEQLADITSERLSSILGIVIDQQRKLHDVVKTIQQQQNIIQSEVQQQQKKLKAHVVANVQRQQEHLRMKKQE